MTATTLRNRLLVGGRVVARFPSPIATSFVVPEIDLLVVRTARRDFRDHRNVWGLHADGRRKWRVGASGGRSRFGLDPFNDVGMYDATVLLAHTMRGVVTIDPATGAVTEHVEDRLRW